MPGHSINEASIEEATNNLSSQNHGIATNTNANSHSESQVRKKSRDFFRSVQQRLRVAAFLSRARRAENTAEIVNDNLADQFSLIDLKKCVKHDSNNPMKSSLSCQQKSCNTKSQDMSFDSSISMTRNYILSTGEIHFWKNFAFEEESHPFLKVTHDIDVEKVAHIMHKSWKMKPPRIVSLIISNVESVKQWTNIKQITSFQKGLIKAANTTNMWIFTNGANLGTAKLIGDAVYREHKQRKAYHCHSSHSGSYNTQRNLKSQYNAPNLNFIGVIRDDMIKYSDMLGDGTKKPSSEFFRVNIENTGNCPEDGRYELNSDHTHFIAVQDSTINKTGINLFILRLMQFLSTVRTDNSGDCEISDLKKFQDSTDLCSFTNLELPVVALLIQGGYDCARLVLDCLKRHFPIVVLKGSGGLADLLSYAYTELEQKLSQSGSWGTWDTEYVENFLKPELVSKINHYFGKINAISRNIFRDRILECVHLAKQKDASLLTILNIHNCSECDLENLSEYLLRALFKSKPPTSRSDSKKTSRVSDIISDDKLLKELYLTVDWNRSDVARTEVLSRDMSYVIRLQKDLFASALLRPDREQFIDLFLSHGFSVHKFITPTRLKRLFKHIYNEEFFHTICWEGVLGHSITRKLSKHFIDTDLNWLIESCTGLDNFVNSDHLYYNVMSMYIYDASSAERKSIAILTLWSIFGNRHKLAKTLWKHSDQPIHLALIASMVNERLSWYVGETSLKMELKQRAKEFSDMATGVLDYCYKEIACKAFDVLSEESPDWNFKTAVDIAANARNKQLLAHPCCQKWLTNTFQGKIRIREMNWGFLTVPTCFKILLCAFFIFPMYIWVRFKPKLLKLEPDKGDEGDEDEKDGGYNFDGNDESTFSRNSLGPINDNSTNGADIHPKWMKQKSQNNLNSGKSTDYATFFRDRELVIRQQPPLLKMIILMWTAPITKFYTFQFFYIFYLLLFSYAVLLPSCGNPILDYTICVWTSLTLIESIRRTWILYRKYTSIPMVFKCLEILAIIIFVTIYTTYTAGLGLKYLPLTPYGRKVTLCIALLYFYYRMIAVYLPISPTLGPLLYRLRLMVIVDFVDFMRMALVVIISGGVVMQALLFPDYDLTSEVIHQAFDRAWFSLFLTPTSDLSAHPSCKEKYLAHPGEGVCYAGIYNHTAAVRPCPVDGIWPYIFSIQYFVFLKLILLTLLYALFAATASRLAAETDAIWKYQRYILVVDFANRLSLPPPLSIFCYIYFILKWIYKCISCRYLFQTCKNRSKKVKHKIDGMAFTDSPDSEHNIKMSKEDYNFWKDLTREYSSKQENELEVKDMHKKQFDQTEAIATEIEYEKKVLRKLMARMTELERMMNLSHVYLENLLHVAHMRMGSVDSTTHTHTMKSHHILSRQSPYPGTRIQRIQVPDKYVPWEVMWINYEPVAYTKDMSKFSSSLGPYVDEDILFLKELQAEKLKSPLPVYAWNCSSTNAADITTDRSSWIMNEEGLSIIYKLENGIPLNPFGRTGLRGKGALPRWGPNHFAILIITRQRHSKVPLSGAKVFEFVVEKDRFRIEQISLPTRFVADDNPCAALQDFFKTDTLSSPWTDESSMIQFLQSCIKDKTEESSSHAISKLHFESHPPMYMDDIENTDQAWKEVKLYHFHFLSKENIHEKLNTSISGWRVITEDVFIKLPSGQSAILQNIANKLQANIL